MSEYLNILDQINNPLTLVFGLILLLFGFILKMQTFKPLNDEQVDRLLNKVTIFIFILAVLCIPLGFINISKNSKLPGISNDELALDDDICKSLEGKYDLSARDYVFIDYKTDDLGIVKGIRGIATKGYWNAYKCKRDSDGNMILHGIDESEHTIEVKIDDKYYEVTRLTGKLISEIYINKNGNLYARKLFIDNNFPLLENKNERKSKISRFSDQTQRDILNAIAEYKKLRRNRIIHSTPDSCFPTVGVRDKKTFVISYCPTDMKNIHPEYFRAMVKCSDGRCSSIYDKL